MKQIGAIVSYGIRANVQPIDFLQRSGFTILNQIEDDPEKKTELTLRCNRCLTVHVMSRENTFGSDPGYAKCPACGQRSYRAGGGCTL